MRRTDTRVIGDLGEDTAKHLLENRNFEVEVLPTNYRTYDLIARKNGREIWVSVKTCRNEKRELRIGNINALRRLRDEDVMICLLSRRKGEEIDLASGDIEIWIVPGGVARDEGIAVHEHYHKDTPLDHSSRKHTVMVKDKIDKPNGRSIAGAAFHRWSEKYRDNWDHLEKLARGFA